MLNEFPAAMSFMLCALAIWRLTHFLVAEDGPWDVVVRVRVRLGDSVFGRAMDCFYCMSLWFAIPFAFMIASHILSWMVAWLSLSAAASLLEQATNHSLSQTHITKRKDGRE
jgi:hypothetical protein